MMAMKTGSPSLFGRPGEIGVLHRSLGDVTAGRARAVVVTGEVGVGKTALVRSFVEQAGSAGAAVAWSSCWEIDESPAYWPWRTALAGLGAGKSVTESMARGDGPPEVFEAVARFLADGDETTVIVLDDAHGADEASLSLAALCARSLLKARFLLALTVCEEDVVHGSRKARLLDAISRESERIELFGLDRSDALELFAEVHGEPAPPILADGIFSATQGNPLLVQEISREMKATGDIFRPDHSLGFKMPRGAHAITERMAGRLDPETRAVLADASVLGRRFSLALLDGTNGGSSANSSALDAAVARGAVRALDALGTFEFTHPLLREALYEGLSNDRRAELHLRAAETLEATNPSSLADIAHHRFKAGLRGGPERAMEALIAAARAASEVGSMDEANRHRARAARLAEAAGLKVPELGRDGDVSPRPPAPGGGPSVFRLDGEFWTVTFGEATSRLKDSRGMGLLARLLADPHRELHALDLAGESTGARALATDTGPLIDEEARSRYKRRLEELEDEIAEAELMNDVSRREKASNEKTFLIEELKAATGLGGRARRSGSASERARVSTTRSIRSALRRIAAVNEALGEHLDRAIRTGTFNSYDPDPNATPAWEL